MFNTQKDQLFTLIKSLTKAEKRSFKLYVNRFSKSGDAKFIQLFDAMDKLQEYDEAVLLKKLKDTGKKQLPNLKRHLYKQILTSLRLIYINKKIDIEIREQIDFARILYGKGMYMQSLRILERIKQIAVEHHQDILHLEILEFEKLIEARHITRSRLVVHKMEELLEEADRRSLVTHASSRLSNFNIQMHGWYIENGHVASEEEMQALHNFYQRHLPNDLPQNQGTFFEKVNLYQANMWFHYILLNYEQAIVFARMWVNLFETEPQVKVKDPDLYMRGFYYLLTLLFMTRQEQEFERYLQQFNIFIKENKTLLNDNSQMIGFVYLYLSKLNFHFLTGDFESGLELIPEIKAQIKEYEAFIDPHRLLLFNYKIAYLYFALGKVDKALDYLNEVIHLKDSFLRNDLQYASRLLHLLCHYQLKNYDLLDYLLTSFRRSISHTKDGSSLYHHTAKTLTRLVQKPEEERSSTLQELKGWLETTTEQPFERKNIFFLNVPLWIQSQLEKKTIAELLQQSRKQTQTPTAPTPTPSTQASS